MNDKKVEEMLKDYKKDTNVPTQFSNGIDDVLNRLPEKTVRTVKKKKTKKWFYSGISAAALSACLIGSGFVSPVMANVLKEVPVIGSIFTQMDDPILQKVTEQGMITELQKEATDQGITLAIKEVFYDGARLAIGYELTMAENHKPVDSIERGQGVPLHFSATMNGENNLQYMADFEQYPVGEQHYVGKIDMYLDIIGETASPLMMQLHVSEINNIKGNWQFNFPIENEKLVNETVTFAPSVADELLGVQVKVKEVAFTPATTQLIFEKTGPKDKIDDISILIFDEQGVHLGGIAAGEPPIDNQDGTVTQVEKASLPPMSTIPENLKITLVETKTLNPNAASIDYELDVNNGFPHSIPMGKDKNITVTDIQFEHDKTLVYIEINGELSMQNHYFLLESNGSTLTRTNNPIGVKDKVNTFILEYPAVATTENVKITTNVIDQEWERQWKLTNVDLMNKK